MHLSGLLGRPTLSPNGESVGKVDDVIVRLRGGDYPWSPGWWPRSADAEVFLPMDRVAELSEQGISWPKPRWTCGGFERREGEVLLRQDILGHRLIDVAEAELVRAWDVELRTPTRAGCLLPRHPPAGPPARAHPSRPGHPCQDWKAFEPLIGHTASVRARAGFGRVRAEAGPDRRPARGRLPDRGRRDPRRGPHRPRARGGRLRGADPDIANRLFEDMTDAEVADVIAHMRADDAADAIAELPQNRRVNGARPAAGRRPDQGVDPPRVQRHQRRRHHGRGFLAVPDEATVEEALRRIRLAESVQPEALLTVHAVDEAKRLAGPSA